MEAWKVYSNYEINSKKSYLWGFLWVAQPLRLGGNDMGAVSIRAAESSSDIPRKPDFNLIFPGSILAF